MINRILIIEDEKFFSEVLSDFLRSKGYSTVVASSGSMAFSLLKHECFPVLLIDQNLPDIKGIDIAKTINSDESVMIFMSAYPSIRIAVDAIKAGAFDYISKPFDLNELEIKIEKALKYRKLLSDSNFAGHIKKQFSLTHTLIGKSKQILKLKEEILKIAKFEDMPVLLYGETGSGKEVVARAIHNNGSSKDGPFIAINCASMSEGTMDSALFGHRRGSFTGATDHQKGAFVLSEGGTLFLDEITEMPISLQAKLLRAVETRTFYPLGSEKSVNVRSRIIVATNRDPNEAVKTKILRNDLMYRVASFIITVPPLRERVEDIPLLMKYFITLRLGEEKSKNVKIPEKEINKLLNYSWPGNIRELKNITDRALMLNVISSVSDLLSIDSHSTMVSTIQKSKDVISPLNEVIENHIKNVLKICEGNKTKTAKLLNISLSTLKRKIKKFEN